MRMECVLLLNSVLRPLQLIYTYVETDDKNDEIQKPRPPFQGHGLFYIPENIDMVRDGYAFDFSVCSHWVKDGYESVASMFINS